MFGILQAQAPVKQTATDAIITLSSRLSSGKLLEDRRAAILGLRSFSKEYPASVASGALRSLIAALSRDADDVDTVKLVLETLLMLFNPYETSPEASDEISLWLADEFTQRQENVTTLLDLLNTPDFYPRLYSLQLLAAVLSARPQRTQECVLTAPLGIARLVAILDDRREAIRNECLLLLISLTPSSNEIQKLVAFENVFDRIFSIINSEGGLALGGITIQDCLSLLANLLRLNVSNQSFFRETGCVPKLAKIMAEAMQEQEAEDDLQDAARLQRDKNMWGILAVLRLFLVRGGSGTVANQVSFWQSGIVTQVLLLAFGRSTGLAVRAEALTTCADLIRGNAISQEGFAQLQVNHIAEDLWSQTKPGGDRKVLDQVNVIHGLLDLTLTSFPASLFDVRMAASECIKAYIYQHAPIRLHFLRRAIEGHNAGVDDTPNVLSTVLRNQELRHSADPYRVWFASVIILHLIFDDSETKTQLMSVREGDDSAGEEVVTCIQALTGALITSMQRGDDERVSVGYMMLLCAWLFEDPDAVNDFLGEGSSVQSLVHAATQGGSDSVLAHGMCMVLLGIVYEFSTKDSPIPRSTLHAMISSNLGREKYIDKLTKLRENPILRDFEVLHQGYGEHSGGLPEVFFDSTFVIFLKDNFSRLLRAIDRDPGFEVPVVANGVQKGISRELVDSLRTQLEEKAQALQKAENDLLNLDRMLGQEQADHRKAKETANLELNRIRAINQSLHQNHQDEVTRIQKDHRAALTKLQLENQRALDDLQSRLRQVQQEARTSTEQASKHHASQTRQLEGSIQEREQQLKDNIEDYEGRLRAADEEHKSKMHELETRARLAEEQMQDAQSKLQEALSKIEDSRAEAKAAKESLEDKEKARQSVQTELDDLLIVLADIEEKRANDKGRLKALGEATSDDSEDDDEAGGEKEEDTEDGAVD